MAAKCPAVHLESNGSNACSVKAKAPVLTADATEVTCKRCLALMKKDAEPETVESPEAE